MSRSSSMRREMQKAQGTFEGATARKLRLAREAEAKKLAEQAAKETVKLDSTKEVAA